MNLPKDFIFSQSSLQDYVDCPRRFQLRYLQHQRWPAAEVDEQLEFEQRMKQGERFHHMVHQHLVGVPAEVLLQRLQDEELKRWFEDYLKLDLLKIAQRYPEMSLSIPLGEFFLMAKFDLLLVSPEHRALIVDWKTSPQAPRRSILEQRLQTIVYRYVLAKGGEDFNEGQAFDPEQIIMLYHYLETGQSQRFVYDAEQLAHAEDYLLRLIHEIQSRPDFPLTPQESACRFCVYRSLCNRGTQAGSLDEMEEVEVNERFQLDLDDIDEIEV